MLKSTLRRTLAVGSFGIIGSVLAFIGGARIGASLDHHTRCVSVAHIPMPTIPARIPEEQLLPPSQIARK